MPRSPLRTLDDKPSNTHRERDVSKAGQKILDGLRDAVNGNFTRVTIEGQTWVRIFPADEDLRFPEGANVDRADKPVRALPKS